MLLTGDPAPSFVARTTFNDHVQFSDLAGRYIVISFLGTASHPMMGAALSRLPAYHARFAQIDTVFLGVSIDPDDERCARVVRHDPGVEFVWDFDRAVSRLFGASRADGPGYIPHTLILDRCMRVVAVIPLEEQRALQHLDDVVAALDRLPPLLSLAGNPPILQVPSAL